MFYGGVNAKIGVMKSRLLKADDYYNLSQSTNVYEAGEKLKSYSDYTDIVEEALSAGEGNRHVFERRLHFALNKDYKKINGFIRSLDVKKYLEAYFLKREIHIIKQKLSSLYDVRNLDYGFNECDFCVKEYYHDIDIDALVSADNIRSFIDSLQESRFYNVLNDVYNEGATLFDFEIALDFYYYNNLWKTRKRALKGINNAAALIVNGSEIDVQNIIWIYRLKNYYKFQEEVIYKYILPINYKLKPDTISKMAEAKDEAELMEIVRQTPYGYAFDDTKRIEMAYYKIMDNAHKLASVKGRNSVSVTLDYLFRKNVELENIISVFEGVKYSMKPEDIMANIRIAT